MLNLAQSGSRVTLYLKTDANVILQTNVNKRFYLTCGKKINFKMIAVLFQKYLKKNAVISQSFAR